MERIINDIRTTSKYHLKVGYIVYICPTSWLNLKKKNLILFKNVDFFLLLRLEAARLNPADVLGILSISSSFFTDLEDPDNVLLTKSFLKAADAAYTRSFHMIINKVHYGCLLLDPRWKSIELDQEEYLEGIKFIKEVFGEEDWKDFEPIFDEYQAEDGIFKKTVFKNPPKSKRPSFAWETLNSVIGSFTPTVKKILSICAFSVGIERTFSALSFIHSKARNKMAPKTLQKALFVYWNEKAVAKYKKIIKPMFLDCNNT